MNEIPNCKPDVQKGIDNFFQNYHDNTAEAQISRMGMLKWSSGGYMLYSPEENSQILQRLKNIASDTAGTSVVSGNVPEDIKTKIRESVQKANTLKTKDTPANVNTVETGNTQTTTADEEPPEQKAKRWTEKLKRIRKGENSTPASRFKDSIETFAKSKKRSPLYDKTPETVNKNLEELNKPGMTVAQADKLVDSSVTTTMEAHKVEHRFPMIKAFNDMNFKWQEYQDSLGHHTSGDILKPHTKAINKNMTDISDHLAAIYQAPPKDLPYKKNSSNLPLLEAQEPPDPELKLREVDRLVAVKSKAGQIGDRFSHIEQLDQVHGFSSDIQNRKIELQKGISWLKEQKEGGGNYLSSMRDTAPGAPELDSMLSNSSASLSTYSGYLSDPQSAVPSAPGLDTILAHGSTLPDANTLSNYAMQNNPYYTSLNNNVNSLHAIYSSNYSNYMNNPQSKLSSALPKMLQKLPADSHLAHANSLINKIGFGMNDLIHSNKDCCEFKKYENVDLFAQINNNVGLLKERVSELGSCAAGLARKNMDRGKELLAIADDKFNQCLAASGIDKHLDGLKSKFDKVNDLKNDAKMFLADKEQLIKKHIADVENTMSMIQDKIQDAIQAAEGLLNTAVAKIMNVNSMINGMMCNLNPASLIMSVGALLPFSNHILLMLKSLYDTIEGFEEPVLNEIKLKVSEILNMSVAPDLTAIDAMKGMLMGSLHLSNAGIQGRLGSLQDLHSHLMSQYNGCSLASPHLNRIQDSLNDVHDHYQNYNMQPPDPAGMRNNLMGMKKKAMGFGNNNPYMSVYSQYKQAYNQLKGMKNNRPGMPGKPGIPKVSPLDYLPQLMNIPFPGKPNLMEAIVSADGCLLTALSAMSSAVAGGPGLKALGVASGAGLLQCCSGIAPFSYMIAPTGEVYAPGETIGPVLAPTLCPSCGGCVMPSNALSAATLGVPPYPCMAMAHLPFSPGSSQVMAMKGISPAFIAGDTAACMFAPGAQIMVAMPGQMDSFLNK